jgi:DNA-directed RNA polymerase specialized sigma24 family protein
MQPQPAPEAGSVTSLIPGLRQGDRQAIGRLWERYYHDMVRVAWGKLYDVPALRDADHDVAIEAFLSFCARIGQDGQFPNLDNRTGLIRLLTHFTICKALDFRKWQSNRRAQQAGEILDGFPGRQPLPEFQAEVTALLDKLRDEDLRKIALFRMEGLTHQEIAARCDCGVATVYRRLAVIRGRLKSDWENLMGAWKPKGEANANE